MQNELFEAALGVAKPWYVNAVDFDTDKKALTISIDFVVGTRFPAAGWWASILSTTLRLSG
jgi:hypothetical protein